MRRALLLRRRTPQNKLLVGGGADHEGVFADLLEPVVGVKALRLKVFAPDAEEDGALVEPAEGLLEQSAAYAAPLELAPNIEALQLEVPIRRVRVGQSVWAAVGVADQAPACVLCDHHLTLGVADPRLHLMLGVARRQKGPEVGRGIADLKALGEGLTEGLLSQPGQGGDVFLGRDAKGDRHDLLQAAWRRSFKR